MQLSSASLPVGGYSFSQGLEYAIDAQWLKTVSDIEDWLINAMLEGQAKTDIPILLRQYKASQKSDMPTLDYWNNYLLASRESRELYEADIAMGKALFKLLPALDMLLPAENPAASQVCDHCSFVTAFAWAAAHWQIGEYESCKGFLWSWLENQVMATSKLLPLGQTATQRLLLRLSNQIPVAINVATNINDESIGNSLPALAIASARHETQYSRLFRS